MAKHSAQGTSQSAQNATMLSRRVEDPTLVGIDCYSLTGEADAATLQAAFEKLSSMGSKRKVTNNNHASMKLRKRRDAGGDDLQAQPAEVDCVQNEHRWTDRRENMADVARRCVEAFFSQRFRSVYGNRPRTPQNRGAVCRPRFKYQRLRGSLQTKDGDLAPTKTNRSPKVPLIQIILV
jgi:hypothetical protein